MRNAEIRTALKDNNVHTWELAERMGISASYMSVLLRKEFPPEKRQACLDVIKQIAKEQRDG